MDIHALRKWVMEGDEVEKMEWQWQSKFKVSAPTKAVRIPSVSQRSSLCTLTLPLTSLDTDSRRHTETPTLTDVCTDLSASGSESAESLLKGSDSPSGGVQLEKMVTKIVERNRLVD
jgi:hypothetical protein